MSFQFRYQRILDVREIEEEQEQVEFAEIQNRLSEERNKLNDLQDELREFFDQNRRKRTGSISVHDLTKSNDYAGVLKKRIEDQKEVVEQWEDKLEDQREKLIEASQKKRVLEALKENDYEEFVEERLDAERKQEDDITNRQYFRDK